MKSVGTILTATIGLAVLAAGCSESSSPVAPVAQPEATSFLSGGSAAGTAFARYAAIGTSVSMGWRSDGVTGLSQRTSWPALLAAMAGQQLPLPLIQRPGCGAPLAAPLISGVRTSGESAAAPLESRSCAENEAGVTLSKGNLAIAAATTLNALTATPETPSSATYAGLYKRVLASRTTQISSMLAQDPDVVSVELGANEVLDARTGAYVPGVNVFPTAAWQTIYPNVLNAVQSTARYTVLVGLIKDARAFPGFRTGQELWDARESFKRYNVAVGEDCGDANKNNVLFVGVRVPDAVARGAAQAPTGKPFVLSCVNFPSVIGKDAAGNPILARDYVLAPQEVDALNAQHAEMNAFIRAQAAARGFAHFELEVLYGRPDLKPKFDAAVMMESRLPYGPFISLDGFHPSAVGALVLANAARTALNERYRLGIGSWIGRSIADDDSDDGH